MGAIASQITSLTIVYSTVYSDPDQRKRQSSASLAFVREFTGENVLIWWRYNATAWFNEGHAGIDHIQLMSEIVSVQNGNAEAIYQVMLLDRG